MIKENEKQIILSEFNDAYEISTIVQKPFGQAVKEIMEKKKISITEATELTGLNRNFFYTMLKPDCNIEIKMVISICLGFQLDTVSTQLLLQSTGCGFNMNNRIHRAYLYIIEHYKDADIETWNDILCTLGVPKHLLLGSTERGVYKKRK